MPRADVVLVFPYKTEAHVRWGDEAEDGEAEGPRAPTRSEEHQMEAWQARRQAVTTALQDAGLTVRSFYACNRAEIFLRVTAEEQHLRDVAEAKRHRLQLKPEYLSAPAEYRSDYTGRPELNHRDRRVVSHLYQSYGGEDSDDEARDAPSTPASLFRVSDRLQLLDHAVRSHDHGCAGLDVSELMHGGELLQYFPLHEGRRLAELDADWFRAFALGSRIDSVRDYFGERLAMRFLFLSHLHIWLLPPAILGPVLWIMDLVGGSPSSGAPALRCTAVGLWAALLCHFWRRTASRHALRWGTLGAARPPEPMRPEFVGVGRLSPATGRVERHYPWAQRCRRVALSGGVLAVALALLGAAALVLLGLRRGLLDHQSRLPLQTFTALAVEALGGAFTGLARGLTDRENHRTASEYSAHLLAKVVVFRFGICYAPLYYTAFFKDRGYLFGMQTSCFDDDCMGDLGVQLAVFVVIRIAVQHLFEFFLPLLYMSCWGATEGLAYNPFAVDAPAAPRGPSRAERESRREPPDVHEDAAEGALVLFGYVALFGAACPLVATLALASCLLGCFIDQKKLQLMYQRPFPAQAVDNEPWDAAFDAFGCIALVTNAAMAVFSSSSFDSWSYHARILAFIAMEHLLVCARLLVGAQWPAVPYDVLALRSQQEAMVRQLFALPGQEEAAGSQGAGASAPEDRPAPPVFAGDEDDEGDVWG